MLQSFTRGKEHNTILHAQSWFPYLCHMLNWTRIPITITTFDLNSNTINKFTSNNGSRSYNSLRAMNFSSLFSTWKHHGKSNTKFIPIKTLSMKSEFILRTYLSRNHLCEKRIHEIHDNEGKQSILVVSSKREYLNMSYIKTFG